MSVSIHTGNCRTRLREMPEQSVHCCVTSPPYFGLRDYGTAPVAWDAMDYAPLPGMPAIHLPAMVSSLGREPTIEAFVGHLVAVFREVHRVLRDDGTLWMNLGDSYAGNGAAYGEEKSTLQGAKQAHRMGARRMAKGGQGLKPKDLMGIPWRVALALEADGWYLRQDIIWAKPNPMPESVNDRCTRAHEYLFLLTKSQQYYFDQEAILEPCSPNTHARLSQAVQEQVGSARANGGTRVDRHNPSFDAAMAIMPTHRNKRSVWNIATQPYKGAHFATFPHGLVEPCILAGCPAAGTVLDPFGGAGTTAVVAEDLGRDAVLVELNPEYVDLENSRLIGAQGGLPLQHAATA